MSSWWCITLSATGELARIKEFQSELRSLFDYVSEVEVWGGMLIAHVTENYGGRAALEAAIERYPDLTFNGIMAHEQAQPGETYRVFVSIGGEPEWRECATPDEIRDVTPDELAERIAQVDRKIAHLSVERELYASQLRTYDTGDKISADYIT